MTLSDIVFLVVENNRLIKNAYLERIAQQQELRVAEDKFVPDFTPSVSLSVAQFERNQTTTDADLGLGATVSVKVPTGGELSFRWATNGQTVSQNGLDLNINDNPFAQNLELSFRQPLLRGYGVDVNRASVDIARLTEQVNILDLKSTLINTITEVIIAYRELIRAQERLKIAQLSLARAQESLANNRLLIEAGRLAPVDIVQSETEVARRQVSSLEAENNLAAARLALLTILDIDKTTVIVASDPLTIPAVTLNLDKLRAIALENQPDYLKAQLDLERTQLALLQAENNRRWDLNLNTSYGYASDDTSDLRVGLGLSRKIGDLTVERDFKRSLVNKLKAENTLKEQRETLDLQLMDRIRDVNLSFAQVELARKVTQSSERQLEIAREKQRLGREITVFELIGLQDELVQARTIELNAIINYLNALTRLDQTLGTTLDTWQVVVEKNVN
ncbi:MAG: TolC family protein [Coleofasciculaceae cyanobacterium]